MSEQRLHDIELAVLELARVVTGIVEIGAGVSQPQREGMLHAIDHVRALCSPETDDDPDDDPPAAAALPVPVVPHDCIPLGYLAIDNGNDVVCLYRTLDLRTEFCTSPESFTEACVEFGKVLGRAAEAA